MKGNRVHESTSRKHKNVERQREVTENDLKSN